MRKHEKACVGLHASNSRVNGARKQAWNAHYATVGQNDRRICSECAHLEGQDPLVLDAKLLAHGLLLFEVHERRVVVGGI